MAFSPSFVISTTDNPSQIVLNDNSTGSDGAITSRQILLYLSSNTLLTSAIPWSLATNPITISPLQKDYSLNVVVNWLNSGGTALYTSQQIFAFVEYAEQFLYGLVQSISTSPPQYVLNDNVFLQNFFKLNALVEAANLAVDVGGDIGSSQYMISLYQPLIQNQALNF